MTKEVLKVYNGMSEAEFNSYFVANVLNANSLECFDDEKARYLITEFIIPITEWEQDVIESTNIKTVMFWYLMRVFYLNFEKDTAAGIMTDEIYQFFDGLVLT